MLGREDPRGASYSQMVGWLITPCGNILTGLERLISKRSVSAGRRDYEGDSCLFT